MAKRKEEQVDRAIDNISNNSMKLVYKFKWLYGNKAFEDIEATDIDDAYKRLAMRTRDWSSGYVLFSITKQTKTI